MKAPLIMPVSGISLQEFEPQRVDYMAPEASGAVGGVQAGFPLWAATWTVGSIGEDRSDEFRSFIAELRGQIRTFYGRDLRRPYPKAYPEGFTAMTKADGSPFLGTASSWSSSINSEGDCLLTLNGLPAGFILQGMDYVGFAWDDAAFPIGNAQRRALVRLNRGTYIANSVGTVVVKVEPAIPACVPTGGGASAYLDNPCCVMRQVTSQTKLDAIDRRGAVRGGTIVAIQDLRQ